MGEESQPKVSPGRPRSEAPAKEIKISNMDSLTFRMLGTLIEYGRFGRSRPEIALFIIRSWLWENEEKLRAGIAASDKPLGSVPTEQE
jgi:hypothetical protein